MGKSATVYVLDINSTSMWMGDKVQKVKHLVQLMIHEKLLSGRKTDLVSIVLVGSQETRNHMASDDEYQYIETLFNGLDMADLKLLQSLDDDHLHGEMSENSGDIIDGLIVAADLIIQKCKKLKYERRIYIFTDGQSSRWKVGDDPSQLAPTIIEHDIQCNFINCSTAADDNEDFLFQEDNWKAVDVIIQELQKAQGQQFTQQSRHLTLDQAQSEIDTFQKKQVAPTTLFKGFLSLIPLEQGVYDAENVDFGIPVSMYARTHEFKLPTFKKIAEVEQVLDEVDMPDHGAPGTPRKTYAPIQRQFNYVSQSPAYKLDQDIEVGEDFGGDDQNDQMQQVDKAQLVKYYNYGSSSIPIQAEQYDYLMQQLKQQQGDVGTESGKEMSLLGFVPSSTVDRHLFAGQSYTVVVTPLGAKFNYEQKTVFTQQRLLMRSFVQTMRQESVYALVRLVRTQKSDPKLALLCPFNESVFKDSYHQRDADVGVQSQDGGATVDDYLLLTYIPFADDMREWTFKSLPQLSASSSDQENQDDIQKMQLMQRFIQRSQFVDDSEHSSQSHQQFSPSNVYYPAYHYLSSCLLDRALKRKANGEGDDDNEDEQFPPVDDRLKKPFRREQQLWNQDDIYSRLQNVFDIRKIEKKKADGEGAVTRVLDESAAPSLDDLLAGRVGGRQEAAADEQDANTEQLQELPAIRQFKDKWDEDIDSSLRYFKDEILQMCKQSDADAGDISKCLNTFKAFTIAAEEDAQYSQLVRSIQQLYLDDLMDEDLYQQLLALGLDNDMSN
ncbi:hypothetical protein MP228_008768 [Amoeboaphelidium protococcarum]|nr:hypothetical protein MP228_008768 [Amoeboaphelidium protococcarum]